ncbi:hypothetical protein L593_01110 [Salinarchaeum sp. Harcht-Bsk1]|uniref:winged helix-turn-helix domain-containing protein n=1 Tax=Salinarchaeum sp. Harcht-Bsk1 TaxID=1333523 RepID=UPI0003423B53|nr:helix-turn-helix domain-containing protein [Salinarchaeum sp. Harcht-Bsk1]AGN00175.1 hypothetical protein L593_01110 [Salinarchaeum sp. Harcht-Bsk1]
MSQHDSVDADDGMLQCVDCVDPAEAFSVIGNDTRLSILEALWQTDADAVSFSDLRRDVGMRDSAQFNYHLGQLTDHFVRKVEDGYELQHAGEKVVTAVIAGSITEKPDVEPFPVEGECFACGSALQGVYEDERLAIECVDCGHKHGDYDFPPGGLTDRTPAEIADAFDQRVRHLHCLSADGVCPECSGRMTHTIEQGGDCCLGIPVRVEHECEQCGHELCSAPGLRLLDHSAVVSFHRERGVHLDEQPYWTLPWCVGSEPTELVSEDPVRIELVAAIDGDELHVTMDGDLDVIETEVREDV